MLFSTAFVSSFLISVTKAQYQTFANTDPDVLTLRTQGVKHVVFYFFSFD